jgi:cytochrome oxidase Cu insertion factor (SCO1/SenC/PrrC family)
MNKVAKQSPWRGRLTLIILALLFLAPVVAAWWFYTNSDSSQIGHTTNHGTLVMPPRPLDLTQSLIATDGSPFPGEYLRGKWTLVYIGDSQCAAPCTEDLYKMRQVRLAQGENINRVQRLFLFTDGDNPLPAALDHYPKMDVAIVPRQAGDTFLSQFTVDNAGPRKAERVYVVDPLGNLMMYYAPDAEPRGMLKDLQRLLKVSSIG